jgi:hypothetical protein
MMSVNRDFYKPEGTVCEKYINVCDSGPCQNNGICTDKSGSYTCKCDDQYYEGSRCQFLKERCKANDGLGPCSKDGTVEDGCTGGNSSKQICPAL